MNDLLPCPFCGSVNISRSVGKTGAGNDFPYIECDDCAANAEPDKWNVRTGALLRTVLEKCKERFDEYEAHHRAKPDHAKADRNKEMSELCRKALES